jgi:hypothetical protein
MGTPYIPSQNGQKVTTSTINWMDQVVREWGAEWNKPDKVYYFSGQPPKDSTDQYQTGIYRRN